MIHLYTSQHNPAFGSATNSTCIDYTLKALERMDIEKDNIVLLKNAEELSSLEDKKPIIIFPGGHALSLKDDLEKVSHKVHSYIHNGGSLIGICAGSILLSESLVKEWVAPPLDRPSKGKIAGVVPFFNFVPLKATAPVFRDHKGYAITGHTSATIEFQSEIAGMAFAEGVKFIAAPDWAGEVVARYVDIPSDNNIAAWHTAYGD